MLMLGRSVVYSVIAIVFSVTGLMMEVMSPSLRIVVVVMVKKKGGMRVLRSGVEGRVVKMLWCWRI